MCGFNPCLPETWSQRNDLAPSLFSLFSLSLSLFPSHSGAPWRRRPSSSDQAPRWGGPKALAGLGGEVVAEDQPFSPSPALSPSSLPTLAPPGAGGLRLRIKPLGGVVRGRWQGWDGGQFAHATGCRAQQRRRGVLLRASPLGGALGAARACGCHIGGQGAGRLPWPFWPWEAGGAAQAVTPRG